jgi:hypothetical protein
MFAYAFGEKKIFERELETEIFYAVEFLLFLSF